MSTSVECYPKRNINIELVRCVAIIFVVMEHVLSELIMYPTGEPKWYFGIFIWTMIKVNVPLFLIVTAFLSFKESLIPHEFFIKKLKRVIIPIIFWGTFYSLTFTSSDARFLSVVLNIINGTGMYHLYFMYWFIGFSFFFPFINYLFFKSEKSFYFYFFVLIVACSLLPVINVAFNTGINAFGAAGIAYFGFLVFYSFVPKLSDKIKSYICKERRCILFFLLYIASCVFTFLAAVFLHNEKQVQLASVISGGSFFVFISSVMFYCFIMNINLSKIPGTLKKIIVFWGGNSFGVYLVHPFVLSIILNKIHQSKFSYVFIDDGVYRAAYFVATVFVVYAVSLLISVTLSKIKYLNKVV
ncbi:acyltransferase [Escherichia coli]|uniref:acyltransferase n=1 Tax=Escherichia coli TaxID=562 RepID=UPI003314D723